MTRIVLLCLLAATLVKPVLASTEAILVLGDSISAAYGMPIKSGWVNLMRERLEAHYPDRYEVVNASVSGDTTAGGLNRLPALLEKHAPDKVIVELGGNDGLRGMSLKQMEANLRRIVDLSRERGARVVLVSIDLPPSYGVFFNRRFQAVYEKIEDDLEVPRVALGFELLNDRNLLQGDGIHPTAEAQPILLEQILPAVVSP